MEAATTGLCFRVGCRTRYFRKHTPVLRSVWSCRIDCLLCCHRRSSRLFCKARREPSGSLSLLGRTVKMDQWVHDVAAGQAPKSLHPHWEITFLHIQQMVHNHQALAFHACHGIPSFCDWPSTADRAHYVVSRIRNDDARIIGGADEPPCYWLSLCWFVSLNRQLVRIVADSGGDLVGNDESLAMERGGRGSVSQVIRPEGQNDTGLPLPIPPKPKLATSWGRFILSSRYAVLRASEPR